MKIICGHIGIVLSSIFLSAPVMAGQQWCSGKITKTYLTEGGTLVIKGDWRNQYTAICNINTERQGVTPEVCKSWLSITMAAQLSGSKVIVYYSDVPSCASVPGYSAAPKPGYIMLES